jgi:hypothetical protein
VDVVFSLHDGDRLSALLAEAGFSDCEVTRTHRTLQLPPPDAFLWQYVHSTPLATLVGKSSDGQRAALFREVGRRWREFSSGESLALGVGVTTVRAAT